MSQYKIKSIFRFNKTNRLLTTAFVMLSLSQNVVLERLAKQNSAHGDSQIFPSLFSKAYAAKPVAKKSNAATFEYTIKPGDVLSRVFVTLGLKSADLAKIIAADAHYLRLDTIRPKSVVRVWVEKGVLKKLEVEFNVASKVFFTRTADGQYEFEELNIKGDWERTVSLGRIRGNFSQSAVDAGLTFSEQKIIIDIFKEKINFSRDLRRGDEFEVISNVHFVGDKLSGQSEILAVRFSLRDKVMMAYLHEDGNYYDEDGKSLQNHGFLRVPLEDPVRVSSHFSPQRRHPVTKKMTVHNGTDFAVPTGTPVVSTADGVVSLVSDHPYAGKYVVIDHGTQYRTRYLHNSKILVKQGQKVSRGERIALSGATGRVSGPHVHYEMLVKNKPVDAMKASAAITASVAHKDLPKFKQMVKVYSKMLERQEIAMVN
ncbi:MAG: peptidoglycan DD-metalloendopeptidase family protein [Enterovibrio sp.]